MLQDLKNHGPLPPISFTPDPTIGKKPDEKQDSLKVEIKTQPGESCSKTVSL